MIVCDHDGAGRGLQVADYAIGRAKPVSGNDINHGKKAISRIRGPHRPGGGSIVVTAVLLSIVSG